MARRRIYYRQPALSGQFALSPGTGRCLRQRRLWTIWRAHPQRQRLLLLLVRESPRPNRKRPIPPRRIAGYSSHQVSEQPPRAGPNPGNRKHFLRHIRQRLDPGRRQCAYINHLFRRRNRNHPRLRRPAGGPHPHRFNRRGRSNPSPKAARKRQYQLRRRQKTRRFSD